jgi:hypothetical protein
MLRGREHVRLSQCRDGESVPASSAGNKTDDAEGVQCCWSAGSQQLGWWIGEIA